MRIFCLILCTIALASCGKRDDKDEGISMDLSDFTLSVEQLSGEVNGKPVTTEMKTYSARLVIWNREIEISFDPDELNVDPNEFVSGLSEQAQWVNENRSVIEDSIISELFELKNSRWLEEYEKPVSREQFLNAMVLTGITFFTDGSCEMYFEDGDLFWGHFILVGISHDRRVEDVTLAG